MRDLSKKKAFLFDFDGVITDSEPYSFRILRQLVLDNFGVMIDDSFIDNVICHGNEQIAAALGTLYGVKIDAETLIALLADYPDYYTGYEGIVPFPGLREFFEAIKGRGGKIAVVSSTASSRLRTALSRMGLSDFPSVIIGGDMTERRKPDPMPYLMALEALSVSAEDSAAFEDSPVGIRAAKAAGIYTVAFTGSEVRQDISLADDSAGDYLSLVRML